MMGDQRWALRIFIVVLVFLHFILRIGMGLGALAPDLLVIALLLAARELPAGRAAGLGLLLGVLEGAVVPETFGSSALALTILGFLGARTRDFFAGDGLVFVALYVFAGKWLFDFLVFLFTGALVRPDVASLLLISPLAALYAAVAGVIAVAAYRAVT